MKIVKYYLYIKTITLLILLYYLKARNSFLYRFINRLQISDYYYHNPLKFANYFPKNSPNSTQSLSQHHSSNFKKY